MNICFLVGDISGDLHCEYVIRELKTLNPNIHCWGMAGDRMSSAGCEVLVPTQEMSVMGFFEVIERLPKIRQNELTLKDAVLKRKPQVIVYVDYPSFNLRFAKWVKQQKTLQLTKNFGYISPQVWAWRSKRIYSIAKYYDGLALIFPFEKKYYESTNLTVRYVGHPLLDELPLSLRRSEAREKLGLPANATIVSFLPGSRTQELHYHTQLMCDTFQLLRQSVKEVVGIVPTLSTIPKKSYQPFLDAGFLLFENLASEVLVSSDVAVVASGTATLQTALLGVPMVVVYKTSPLTFFIGKRIVQVNKIALANLVMEQCIAPERLQNDANAKQIFQDVIELMGEKGKRQVEMFQSLHSKLGSSGASKKVAEWIYELAQQSDVS